MYTGEAYINDADVWTTYSAYFIENSYSNLLKDGDMKEDAYNDARSQPGKQVFSSNPQPKDRDVEVTLLFKCASRDEYLTKYENLLLVLKNEIRLKIVPLKKVYVLKRVSYLSLDPYNAGSAAKLVIKFNEPNPANRIKL